MERSYVFNLQGVDLFIIKNFVSPKECDYLCNLIKANNEPSTVTGSGDNKRVYGQGRTSQSSFLDARDQIVKLINSRISEELGIPQSYGEPIQGQFYRTGEFFNDHTDYFDQEVLERYSPVSGQRTWTAMIYLNDVEEGGHTEFPVIGKSFAPVKGTALFWKNSEGNGSENPATLHSGCPVIHGEKIIITKWFRENVYQPIEDHKSSSPSKNIGLTPIATRDNKSVYVKIEYVHGIPHARYKSIQDIPAITKVGFKKASIPKKLYQQILDFYTAERRKASPEFDPLDQSNHLSTFIQSDETHYPTEIIPLTAEMKELIFNGVQPILEEWSGRNIVSTFCYGIRTYRRGAKLKMHTDGYETRIVSAILNVDQQVDVPWPLQIEDHEGVEHEVFLEPGEMALYESAILRHGRVKPLQGDYYSNLFVHFINID